jgi:hypothetical protein
MTQPTAPQEDEMNVLRLVIVFVLAGVPSAMAAVQGTGGGTTPQGLAALGAPAEPQTGPLAIRVLSNRADLISGGDALVQVVMPDKATALRQRPTVVLNGVDVGSAFAWRADGRFVGLVEGLVNGANTLSAKLGQTVRITITNYPIGGPIFAGPQVQPWYCTTQDNGLGPATDDQCNAPTVTSYKYRSSVTGQFADYDPASPPVDLATTTTDQGVTVPYVVRVERGTMDRGIYDIAVLADPAAWNHKLVVPFGQSTAPYHKQSTPTTVLDGNALSRGFMVANNSLQIQGKNANTVVNAESLMMLKEHILERYGSIRYTIGNGCSGGSIGQQVIATSYPGLLDGLTPQCSFPDTWTTANEVTDCALLARYWETTSPQLWAALPQRALVSGHQTAASCNAWIHVFAFDQSMNPSQTNSVTDCGVTAEEKYDAETNPGGVRCTLTDYMVAIFGRRASDGFASRPLDNVGIQYGLNALNGGLILPEQFVDMNEKAGGLDIDWKWQPQRMQADPGSIATAYRTGQITDGKALANVPIIDLRGSSNNEIHTDFHSWELRARLVKANGNHDNQVIWTSPVALAGDTSWNCGGGVAQGNVPCSTNSPLLVMDDWLSRIEADRSTDPLAFKVRRDRPPLAVDSCWIGGLQVTDTTTCRTAFPYYAVARVAAGGPFTHDVMKCQLKPLSRSDYAVAFTDDQWARLQATFPTGVCDWTKPSVDAQPSVPWLTFAAGPGGRPLGAAPVSR